MEEKSPEIHQQLSLSEILHLISGDVVDGHSLVPTQLQAAEDVVQQVHVVKPAASRQCVICCVTLCFEVIGSGFLLDWVKESSQIAVIKSRSLNLRLAN